MEVGDLHDWEVLHGSDSESIGDDSESKCFDCIDGDSGGAIRPDYFSLDSPIAFKNTGGVSEDGVSVNSNNPSWIDPGSDTRSPRKEFTEFWPDSASDRSDDHKFAEFEVNNDLGFAQNEKIEANSDKYWSDSTGFEAKNEEFVDDGMEVKGVGDEVVQVKEGGDVVEVEKASEGEKRVMAWWKLPLELLKYCMFRMNPAWTVPMAAAVMGFMILGRRYYRMKRKSKSVHMKVTVDDQVSYFEFYKMEFVFEMMIVRLCCLFTLISARVYRIYYRGQVDILGVCLCNKCNFYH